MLEENNPSTSSGQRPEMPLKTQADLLGVSYSSLFYEPVPPSARELAIKRRIDEIYTDCPFYGSRKIAFLLRPEFGVARPTVQAYMREMGLFAYLLKKEGEPKKLIAKYGNKGENTSFLPVFGGWKKRLPRIIEKILHLR
jgi:hypothetical protein